jgi:hypothetical protein
MIIARTRFVNKLDHHRYGPEYLFLHDTHVRVGVGEHRWLDEEPLRAVPLPPSVHRRSVRFTTLDVGHNPLHATT